MKRLMQVTLAVFLLGFSSVPVLAQTPAGCGLPAVTTDVVFDIDLNCSLGQNGLIVGADGITIELNGKTLSCGLNQLGACQNTGAVGIDTNGHSDVLIKGPGRILGFDVGVHVSGGNHVTVENLTACGDPVGSPPQPQCGVTGPPSGGVGSNSRVSATGILVDGVSCPGVIIDGNIVEHHRYGIMLDGASCVKVNGNTVHLNNSDFVESFGILLNNSSKNVVTNNTVDENGTDVQFDGGLVLSGLGTMQNRVAQNSAQFNCGDGISARDGAERNAIRDNYAHNNPHPFNGNFQQCLGTVPGVFFDLAGRNEGSSGNRWMKNDCGTQSPDIPAGECP